LSSIILSDYPILEYDNDLKVGIFNRAFVICLIVSVIAHLLIMFFLINKDFTCSYCHLFFSERNAINLPLSVNIKLHQKEKFEQVQMREHESEVKQKVQTMEQEFIIIDKNVPSDMTQTTKASIIAKQHVDVVDSKIANSTQPRINYFNLNNVIKSVVHDDGIKIQKEWIIECERHKKLFGSLDCISTEERLDLKHTDPYQLASIFKSLDTSTSNVRKKRLIKKILTNKSKILEVINHNNLDKSTRKIFQEELDYLHKELKHQDCGGTANSGSCAGEVDLVKLSALLTKIYKNVR